MDYINKMLDHLTEAEKADEKIRLWEAWAKDRITNADKLHPDELLHRISKELEHKLVYQKRVNNRTYHAQMAQTYGIVAMAMAQYPGSTQVWTRTHGQAT